MPQRSGVVQPNIDTYWAPDPVFPYGEALVTAGFVNARSMTNGLGLVTRGLLWQLYDIWFDQEYYDGLGTVWANSDSILTTNWTSPAPISTTWTSSQYSQWGEYTP